MPLEDILQLAASLMKHLLDHPPVSDPRSPPRKQRNRRGAQGTEGVEAAAPATGKACTCCFLGSLQVAACRVIGKVAGEISGGNVELVQHWPRAGPGSA